MGGIAADHIETIADALANTNQLKLPARLDKGTVTFAEKQQYLRALLQHDPGVFLERHGKLIGKQERSFFEPLRTSSYEVDFYLKLLEDEDQRSLTKVCQNSRTVCTLSFPLIK